LVYYLQRGEGPVSFEFDEAKSAANKVMHGIDFVEAQELWADPWRAQLKGRPGDEERFLIVAPIGDEFWTAAVTYRGETVRVISVRRSRREEVRAYGRGDQR
jgi:uncharacterized DUF497 family protein